MLTAVEYDRLLRAGKARVGRAACPMCHGKGIVTDPDHRCAPIPCYCALAAAEETRRIVERETFLAAVRR